MPPRRLPGFHPAAGTWLAAGNRFTKRRIVPPVPVRAYTGKITGVPLTGGQASGMIAGIPAGSGTVTSPAAFAVIAQVTIPVAGTYLLSWTVTLAGTVGAGDANNFGVEKNGSHTALATSSNAGATGTYPQTAFSITAAAGDLIQVYAIGGGTSGAIYSATIPAKPNPLTLTTGPQGLGTTWYPAQVTLSTTTGVLDASTAQVYIGTGGIPTQLAASVFSGNGTAAVAIPPIQPGDNVIVTWTNGHPGDIASFNVIGTMDALTTGRG
jgi:hypothetical protein